MKKIFESELNSTDYYSAERIYVYALENEDEWWELESMSHDEKCKYFDVEDTEEGIRKVQVLFGGCWSCEIILEFTRDVLIHFVSEDNADNCFYSSNIIFHDAFVYWVGEEVESVSDIEDYLTYFKARSLKWKMINKNNIEQIKNENYDFNVNVNKNFTNWLLLLYY